MSVPVPETLSPSKLSRFISCPLAFRYGYIDKLPEPSSIHQLRGTLVHRALQLFFGEVAPAKRSVDKAQAALEAAFTELDGEGEFESLEFGASEEAAFRREAATLIERYFELENPAGVHPIGLELDLRHRLGHVELRGIIDRLDRLPSGDLVIVDYKTGRAPRPEQSRARLGGVHFYAFMCEQILGRRPSEVRAMYLKDRVVVVESPTDQSMRGLRQRVLAVWNAIERACATEDFRPNPTALCKSCAFQSHCPAFAPARELAPVAIAN
jgi:putative RecB family exonuclease